MWCHQLWIQLSCKQCAYCYLTVWSLWCNLWHHYPAITCNMVKYQNRNGIIISSAGNTNNLIPFSLYFNKCDHYEVMKLKLDQQACSNDHLNCNQCDHYGIINVISELWSILSNQWDDKNVHISYHCDIAKVII
jgi:hypothetical protein